VAASLGDIEKTYKQRLVSLTTTVQNLSSSYLHTLLHNDKSIFIAPVHDETVAYICFVYRCKV